MITVESSSSLAKSSHPVGVAPPLGTNPLGGVVVPVVPDFVELAECRLDLVPAPLVVETSADQFGDERAPAAGTRPARPAVELGDARRRRRAGRGSSGAIIHLRVDDVEGVERAALAAGASSVFPTETSRWGTQRARFVDPDGHEWTVGAYDPGRSWG